MEFIYYKYKITKLKNKEFTCWGENYKEIYIINNSIIIFWR